jgi:DNA-binding CsgD family transcriptional regulator
MTRPRPTDPLAELSAREREALELVGSGLGNQEIGRRLDLAEKPSKHHMTNLHVELAKLHLRSRVEAALLAHRVGLVPAPDRP